MSKERENANKTSARQGRRRILEYLSAKVELDGDAIAGEVRIELRGRNMLLLNGCRRILKYSTEEIIFAVRGDSVKVSGEGLVCTSYHSGAVSVEGSICSVAFV